MTRFVDLPGVDAGCRLDGALEPAIRLSSAATDMEHAFDLNEVAERGAADLAGLPLRLIRPLRFAKTEAQPRKNVRSNADLVHDGPRPAMIFLDLGGGHRSSSQYSRLLCPFGSPPIRRKEIRAGLSRGFVVLQIDLER